MTDRFTPNDMEREAQRIIDELLPLREAETDKRTKKQLSSRIKTARMMRNWARTRAGYVEGPKNG
jgi:hypothetical protein